MEKTKKILLFYNPFSGNGLFKNNLDFIVDKVQQKGCQLIPVRAEMDKSIKRALSEMDQSEYEEIIVAGGDGTINICVNAMIENDIDLPIAIFPTGTANDFAYYFDLPYDVEEMVDTALGDDWTYADVGHCNDKYFVNVAALGALIDVSQKTDPNLKNTLGVFAYYLRASTEIMNIHPIPVRLITPEHTYEEDMFFMVVMNGRSAGGFKKVSPWSQVNDGKLDVILFRKMPIIEMGPLLLSVIAGNHPNNKNVLYFQTSDLRIESEEDVSTDVDGEHGEKLPLQFSVLPKRLRIKVKKEKESE